MSNRWKVLSSKVLLDRWWLKIREDHVVMPTGAEIEEYHVMEYPDWTMTLSITPSGDMLLVEQYRHGISRMSLEFPSGMLETGEKPRTGALREFREETGYEADNMIPLGHVTEDPSRHTNTAYAFYSDSVRKVGSQQLDETEQLKLVLMSPREVKHAIETGRMVHGLHIGAFYRAIAEGYLTLN